MNSPSTYGCFIISYFWYFLQSLQVTKSPQLALSAVVITLKLISFSVKGLARPRLAKKERNSAGGRFRPTPH